VSEQEYNVLLTFRMWMGRLVEKRHRRGLPADVVDNDVRRLSIVMGEQTNKGSLPVETKFSSGATLHGKDSLMVFKPLRISKAAMGSGFVGCERIPSDQNLFFW